MILSLFLFFCARAWLKKTVFSRQERALAVFFLVYFAFQSLSALAVVDTVAFTRVYKDILFAGLFLFVAIFEKKFVRSLVWVFIAAAVVNFIYQMVILWFPRLFQVFAERFVYAAHLELVNINIERGRLFVETYDEIAIPFVILLLSRAKKAKPKFLYLVLLICIMVPSFLSNFRTRILMLGFALAASLFLILKASKKA